MRTTARRVQHLAIGALLCTAASARAQAPFGSDRLGSGAIAESLKVLRQLQDRVRHEYSDAAAWYHQGMIAWALYERCRHQPPIRQLDCTLPRRLADTALMIAGELEPDNPKYILELGHYLLASSVSYRREGTYFDRLFKSSLAKARATGDPNVYLSALLNQARFHWLRYDILANDSSESETSNAVRQHAFGLATDSARRAAAADPQHAVPVGFYFRDLVRWSRALLDGKKRRPERPFGGEIDYILAEIVLRQAHDLAPDSPEVYRQLAILLAHRGRWIELASLARSRTTGTTDDAWAWMTLGLASYRRGDKRMAEIAFDTGFARMPSFDRRRLDRIERVLGPAERNAYARRTESERLDMERMYWLNSEPLWSRPGDETRLEFLARVAFAELMWTTEERAEYGVNSDRGEVYVRMGPPDRVLGAVSGATSSISMANRGPGGFSTAGPDTIKWFYDYSGRVFSFLSQPRYKTEAPMYDTTVAPGFAAVWDNLWLGRVDSIPVQVARFRATRDSTDVYIATFPHISAIAQASQITGPVRTDLWLLERGTTMIAHDSVLPAKPGVFAFTHRLPPGAFMFRTEASADASMVAGRSTAAFIAGDDPRTGFASNGFGISDVLLTTRVDQPATVSRWSDFTVIPLAGALIRGSELSLVWENYDMGNADGAARYGVTVTIRRANADTSARRNVGARIVGGIAGALGFRQQQDADYIEFQFDRTVPHRAVIVDRLALSLGTTVAGNYLLTLRITDRVTGATAGRSQRLDVVDPPRPLPPPVRR